MKIFRNYHFKHDIIKYSIASKGLAGEIRIITHGLLTY